MHLRRRGFAGGIRASCYFSLRGISQSASFHELPRFLSLLGSIRRYLKRRDDSAAQGSNSQREKGNKKKRGRGKRNLGYEDGDETEEGGFDAKLLFRVLERLGSVLSFVHLNRFLDSLKSLVQTVEC